ncbi:MAG TPA: amidohydrolase family protein, partial [Acidobacteriota bacterium]|nr:amidohydrolase family protein [Acidobacteriota bacterium]
TYRREREGAENFGLTRSVAQLNSDVVEAHRAGWQLWLHAIGDKAQDLALDAFEAALEARPDDDHRHRMEHLGNYMANEVGEATLARARELGVIPVPTAAFMWGSRPRPPDAPSPGIRYPFAKLLEMGFRPPGNADSAGTQTFSLNPLFSLTREVLRTNRDGEPIEPGQAISPLDAIRMHTIWAARAGFEDEIKGSIETGKLADLVVLTEDPLTAPERLMEMRAEATIIDGVVRFRREE